MFWTNIMTTLLAVPNDEKARSVGSVTGLYRHAVKGLSADALNKVVVAQQGETFPDDRRFALLQQKNREKFDASSPEWLHKQNFLCAFSAPQLLSKYQSSYQIKGESTEKQSFALPSDDIITSEGTSDSVQRLLTLRDRKSQEVLLGPVDLCESHGREELANFFSVTSGQEVACVSASPDSTKIRHGHQFGNTSSGVKARGDTRTVHLINAATVADLSKTIGQPLNPTRFRPNLVLDGPEPWSEFEWIGKKIACGSAQLQIITRTVRCDGVSVDPLDPDTVLDIPKLLIKHYPEHGPYLGVYAIISQPGTLEIGDSVSILY